MKRKILKSKHRVKKRDKMTGLREGYVMFEGHRLHVKAISHSHQDRINDKYNVPQLQAKLGYLELEKNGCKDKDVQAQLRLVISDIAGELKRAIDRASIETIMDMVTEPEEEWFETLGPDQWLALTTKVDFFGRFVDLDEIGFEIIKDIEDYFGLRVPTKDFKGRDVLKKVTEFKYEWITLTKKKSNLSTALSSVIDQRAKGAMSTYPTGPSE